MNLNDRKEKWDKESFQAWLEEHKRQVAVGCIAACLVIAAGASVVGSGSGKKAEQSAEETTVLAGTTDDLAAASEESAAESNPLEQDAYPEVNELVQKYYDYMSAGDVDGLSSVEDQISEEEQNRILRSKDLVEGYQNISCYTKKGMEDGSYLVFVYYELKFSQIDTAAPGLSPMYIYTNDEGNLVIFNGEASDELNTFVENAAKEDDVLALREEVKAKYEEAKAADENLAKQEERYLKIAQATEEASTEETTEETAEETAEETQTEENTEAEESQTEEASADSSAATAQNRETRFTESVRLRAEASTEAEYLGTAFQGESVTQIESYENGWSKISYNGKECYCKTEFLE